MSLFSEALSGYMTRSGDTVAALAESAGYTHSHLFRIRQGERPAREREKLERLIDALRLSPSERIQLIELWTADRIGEDAYNRHMAVKAMIESLNRHIDIMPPVPVSAAPVKGVYSGKENVRYMLHWILGSSCTVGRREICIMAQPDDPMFSELLLAVCSTVPSVPVTHIISLYPSGAEKRHQTDNLGCIQNLLPCLLSNGEYRINYHYNDIDALENHYLIMPNVFLMEDGVVLVSKNWDNAQISRETEVISLYRRMFKEQLRVTQPFNQPIPTLFHEVQYLMPMADAGIRRNPEECFYAIAQQPCITPYFKPDVAAYISDMYGNKEALIDLFLNQYQPFLLKSKLVQFFCLSGVYDFLRVGVIWEMGDKSMSPLPKAHRIKMLKGLHEAGIAGKHRFYLIREDAFRLMPDAAMAIYQSGDFTVHIRNEEDHICSVDESGIANALRDFFEYLPDSRLVYSREESLRMLMKVIQAAEEGALDSADK